MGGDAMSYRDATGKPMQVPGACPELVMGGPWDRSKRCNRPVKRDGLCGIHARAKEKAAEREAEREALDAEKLEHTKMLNELGEALGTKVNRYSNFRGLDKSMAVVPVEWLRRMAGRDQ